MIARTPGKLPEVKGCLDACEQCLALLDGIDEDDCTSAPRGFSTSGAYLRHCLEHFDCFFDGLPVRRVDYDARVRNAVLERSPEAMRSAIFQTMDRLGAIPEALLDKPVHVVQAACKDAGGQPLTSSVRRELVFRSSHFLHHLAIVRLTLTAIGTSTSDTIGVAWSTMNWQADRAAAGAGG